MRLYMQQFHLVRLNKNSIALSSITNPKHRPFPTQANLFNIRNVVYVQSCVIIYLSTYVQQLP